MSEKKEKIAEIIRSTSGAMSRILKTIVFNPIVFAIVFFILGARLHETGRLAGTMGKDLKGATVKITGSCEVNGSPRIPALAEDEVKITSVSGLTLSGVVRKTRELVSCDLNKIAIDKLPLLTGIFKESTAIPELTEALVRAEGVPAYKALEKKTLVMTGACLDREGKPVPAFIDELVDVTKIETVENGFVLTGIRKNDRQVVVCDSSSIKYEVHAEKKETPLSTGIGQVVKDRTTYLGETVLVTGRCFPGELLIDPTKKLPVSSYNLANTKVKVLKDEIEAGKVKKILGAVLDTANMGKDVYCDQEKSPFFVESYDSENIKLEEVQRN